jgi:hypothetical protein
MSFTRYDAPIAALLERAFDEAWFALPNRGRWSPTRKADTIATMIRQMLAAADAGERDHDRLVQAALDGIDRT